MARVEKQIPSLSKASVLSHSVQHEEDDDLEVNRNLDDVEVNAGNATDKVATRKKRGRSGAVTGHITEEDATGRS